MAFSNKRTPTLVELWEAREHGVYTGLSATEEARRVAEAQSRLTEVQENPAVPPSIIDESNQRPLPTIPQRPQRRTDLTRQYNKQPQQHSLPSLPTSPETESHSHPIEPTRHSSQSNPAIQALQDELEEVNNQVQQLTRQRLESDREVESLRVQLLNAETRYEQAIVAASPTEALLQRQVETLHRELRASRQRRHELEEDIEGALDRERNLRDRIIKMEAERRPKRRRRERHGRARDEYVLVPKDKNRGNCNCM